MVQVLNYLHEYESVISSNGVTVIDYFTTWCQPCIRIAPEVEKLAQQYPDIKFYKVDIDVASDIATRAGILSIPTFHFYKDGKLVDTIVGANLSALKKMVASLA